MRNGFIGLIAALFVFSAAPALAQSQLELTLDAYVAVLRVEGATIEFSDRIVGDNGSIEYRDFRVVAPDGELNLTTDWVRFEQQPLQPEMTLITFAPQLNAVIEPDGTEEPITVELSSGDLRLLTNAIVVAPELLEVVDFRLSASAMSLKTIGQDADAPIDFDFRQSGMEMSVLVDNLGNRITGAYSTKSATIAYDVDVDGMRAAATTAMSDLEVAFFADLPAENNAENYFADGNEFSFSLTSGPSENSGRNEQAGLTILYETSGGPSRLLLENIDGQLSYSGEAEGFEVGFSLGDGAPLMEFSLGEIFFDFVMPTREADAAGDMRFAFKFTDIVADDAIWNLIDAGGTIPRDPALLDVRLNAKLRLKEGIGDIFSDGGALAGGQPPTELVELESLDIESLDVVAGGASISVGGALEFDNTGAIPTPLGDVQVEVNGLQELTSKLVQLGLLDQMQAGIAMGMMMGFGRPGEKPDQFIAEISFTKQGILANGQPVGP